MDKTKLVLAVCTILAWALGAETKQVKSNNPLKLDMASNSVDDCYHTCSERMFKNVTETLLPKEIRDQKDFGAAWKEALKRWKKKPVPLVGGLKEQHAIAIRAYTLGGQYPVFKAFNDATRGGAGNYRRGEFAYKSLHFLLAEALRLMKEDYVSKSVNQAKRCLQTYRGTKLKFQGALGAEVRFGSFTSSSLSKRTASNFGSETCFKIQTCFGAALASYSSMTNEDEVLIPPHEKFNVTKISRKGPNSWCNVVYSLQSTGMHSNLNCALVP
ncbi:erythroblast NAD(P)(+)--arginine ADP-ribosyltransferase-like [Megalops cyprinoides]|uniref:erythroblast NAD(P)(+)--arginine ADP-ribosyltransferase-like n=1 Tax=Megalops cyprinoides TaxID=118141 RepID=UPI001864132E|nr:erythroblast NAD(P)(+)--arginine ADP-ribosyltransferase-like [Megalops cyprinoides]